MNVTWLLLLIMIREGIVSDVTPCSGKLAGNKQSFCEEVNNNKITFLERAVPNQDVHMLR